MGPTSHSQPSWGEVRTSPAPPSPPGKKHLLVLSDLRPEDSGEVRFQAGPAQSVARLEVEGKRARGAAPRGWVGGWTGISVFLGPSSAFSRSPPRGAPQERVTEGDAFP